MNEEAPQNVVTEHFSEKGGGAPGRGVPGGRGKRQGGFRAGAEPGGVSGFFQDLGRRDSIDMKRFGKSAFFVALVVLVATLFAGTAMAATTYTWDNSGVGDNWDTPDNWDKDASYPGAAVGDTAIFDDPSKIPAGGVGNIYLITHPLALLDVKGNVALTLKCGTNDKDIIADAGKMSVAAGSTLKFAVEEP